MVKPPANEEARLAALRELAILDTAAEACFDELVQAAALVCGVPIALISLVDEKRQWFKARVGLEISETPRDLAFCAYTILNPGEILEVCDATQDPRFKNNSLVAAEPHIRFYAGSPLTDVNGHSLGTLCVIDHQPKKLESWQQQVLVTLSNQVMRLMAMRSTTKQMSVWHDLHERDELLDQLQDSDTRFNLMAQGAAW